MRAARFAGAAPAATAYDAAQDLFYQRRNVDLSAFRFQLDQVYHVAVLGLTPPASLDRAIARILAAGPLTSV